MKRKILITIFVIYLAALLKITVLRSNFGENELFTNGTFNLTLFVDLIAIFKTQGLWKFIYLFVGNIIWFVPLGILLPLINKKICFTKILIIGFCLSFTIEFLQYAFGTGVSEIDDIILNTFGAICGFGLYRSRDLIKNVENLIKK